MSRQGVSCLCLTYGRPHLLEEAIESFLRQSWDGARELVVVNDHPRQTLVLNHPQVVIVNLGRRLRTLGEKRNLSVALARYDNLLVWDDDDIYLPWRIEETMKTLPARHFFKCPNAWVMDDDALSPTPAYNLFHGGTAFTRWLFEQAGGYAAINGGEDADIEDRFQNVGGVRGSYWPHTALPHDRLYYIYRWRHGSYHATGHRSLDDIAPDVTEGEIILEPKWRLPYQCLAREAAAAVVAPVAPVVVPPHISVAPHRPPERTNGPINFIVFSRNRPLQLDGYIRSYANAGRAGQDMSVLYTCDSEYQQAYDEVRVLHPWVRFVRESDFCRDLLQLFNGSEFTCFGCDDCVFTRSVDWQTVAEVMRREGQFAFSLRLGKNVRRSMFSGPVSPPDCGGDGGLMTWDLHASHAHGDFGYPWELNGTVYPTHIARRVADQVQPTSPSLLEADGGRRWSAMTGRSLMSCFHHSVLAVPTVNVVQRDFANPVMVANEIGTRFMLDAWQCGIRLDVGGYRDLQHDCIHVPELYLSNQ